MDFNQAVTATIHAVFAEATVKGCTFDFRQSFCRIQQKGLLRQYEEDSHQNVAETGDVTDCQASISYTTRMELPARTSLELSMKLHAFPDYMERTWIHGDFSPMLSACGATSITCDLIQ